MTASIRIEQVDAAATFPLRQQILRPHESNDELAAAEPDALYFAACEVDTNEVVGSVVLVPERPPWETTADAPWRLRAMVTAERVRGEGVGAALMQAALDHVAANGGDLVWCTARTPAQGFYERAGFVPRGEPWIDPALGPHIAMERLVR